MKTRMELNNERLRRHLKYYKANAEALDYNINVFETLDRLETEDLFLNFAKDINDASSAEKIQRMINTDEWYLNSSYYTALGMIKSGLVKAYGALKWINSNTLERLDIPLLECAVEESYHD